METFYKNYNSLVYKKNDIAAQHCMVRQKENGLTDHKNKTINPCISM